MNCVDGPSQNPWLIVPAGLDRCLMRARSLWSHTTFLLLLLDASTTLSPDIDLLGGSRSVSERGFCADYQTIKARLAAARKAQRASRHLAGRDSDATPHAGVLRSTRLGAHRLRGGFDSGVYDSMPDEEMMTPRAGESE